MDLKQLEYFVQVAEFGSFTLASRFLSIAQPALSRQVRALEVELRQTLFQRTGRGVTLTVAASGFSTMRAASCSRCGARSSTWSSSAARCRAGW